MAIVISLDQITGSKLPKVLTPVYLNMGPSMHFDETLDNIQKVEQYVTTFDQHTAKVFGQNFRF